MNGRRHYQGMEALTDYYRFAFLPQVIVVSILFGVSSSKFDLSTPSHGDTRTVIGNRYDYTPIIPFLV
jgi:NO-binding membrane sensor protein with MHYT domain